MYILESPYNLISNRVFKSKGLYLNRQQDIIYTRHQVVAYYLVLKRVNIQVLKLYLDYQTISREHRLLFIAIKAIKLLFEI